jgi:hypothetical protein
MKWMITIFINLGRRRAIEAKKFMKSIFLILLFFTKGILKYFIFL